MEESERQELIEFYHDAFASAINSGAYEDIEEIWTELTALEPDNISNFLSMSRELEHHRRNKIAGALLLSFVELCKETGNGEARTAALQEAARLLPRDQQLKEQMADHYRQLYSDHPLLEEAIERSGLLRPMVSVEETIPLLEMFLKFRGGDIVVHPSGWGMGRVVAADLNEETLTVDFETRKNHTISFDMAAKILKPVAPDSFAAQKFADPADLKKEAAADPAGLLKRLLSDLGGAAPLKKIKSIITDGMIDSADWSKWWTSAKKAVLKDPYLRLSGGSSGVLELRDEPVSHHDETLEKLRAAGSISEKIAVVDAYTSNLKAAERTSESLGRLADALLEAIKGSKDASAVVQVALVLDDLKALCPELGVRQPKLEKILTPESAIGIVEGITKAPYKRQALLRLKELYPDEWPQVLSKLFFEGGGELWDFAAKELIEAEKPAAMSKVLNEVLAKSREHPEMYLWLCRAALTGKYPAVLGEHSKIDLLEKLLDLVGHLSRSEIGESKAAAVARKKLLAKARDTISLSGYKNLQNVIEDSSQDEARRISNAATMCRGLTDTARDKIIDIIIAEHPDLAPKPRAGELEDNVLYTTREGLLRKQAEFDRVMNEEIPENQKALGLAISFGDLQENAEYAAAREQQGILMEKAGRIKKELNQAKLIDPETVPDDVVSIGTTIEIRSTSRTKKVERYTILGPWDSDAENGIISYLTPMAATFLGRKVGDRSVLDFIEEKEEYEVISIAKAI